MQFQVPIIYTADIVILGNSQEALELARETHASGRKIFLCTSKSYFSFSAEETQPAQKEDNGAEKFLVENDIPFLYEVTGIGPAVSAVGNLSGWLFVTSNGFVSINAKCVVDFRQNSAVQWHFSHLICHPSKEQLKDILELSRQDALQLTTSHFLLSPENTSQPMTVFCWNQPVTLPALRNLRSVPLECQANFGSESCDIIILGRTISGYAAALSASQCGARVILADSGSSLEKNNDQTLHEELLDILKKSGGTLLTDTAFSGVILDNRRLTGLLLADSSGKLSSYHAKCIIDATNRAIVARACGARMMEYDPEEALCHRSWHLDENLHETDPLTIWPDDPFDITRAIAIQHDRHLDSIENPAFFHIPEQSRIVSEIVLSPPDVLMRRTYRDTLAVIHGRFSVSDGAMHPIFLLQAPENATHEVHIPMRLLLPMKLEGLLVIGHGISVHRDCLNLVSPEENLKAIALSAGCAAALAVREGITPRKLEPGLLKKHLLERKLIPEATLAEEDGMAGPSAPKSLTSILANIFFRPDIARRKLQADFEGKPDLMTATVLAFLGDATGRAFIQNAIAKASWTHGWQYENTPDATIRSSPLEALLMALRNIGGAQTAAYTKLCILTADNPLSNIRALALFFIRWPSSAAARDWERILDDTSLQLDIPLSLARCQAESLSQPRYHDILNRHLKRLFAAASLFACQPLSLKARQLLEKYRACPNYHMAIFAMHILKN